ncbi:hypothetical protein ACI0FS_13820 [Ochrobactrum quorumnocens]|uniref:hypothetical protein n=1 Tax=Ochrobactrum quorumnocens TaxID=271865 RepID=UPI000AF59093|nr:hypothetical protein [[Ochrobactrum] quorumnocens]
MTNETRNFAVPQKRISQERLAKDGQIYSVIHRIVRMENIVMEPFSAACLAEYLPLTRLAHLKVYLSSNAATSGRDHHAHFVRVFRGWYRFNEK